MTKKDYYRKRLEIVTEQLETYLRAERAILNHSQSYTIGNTQLNRAQLPLVQARIKELFEEKTELENLIANGGRRKSYRIIVGDL